MRPTVWKAFGRVPRYTALKEALGFYILPLDLSGKSVKCVRNEDRACELSPGLTEPLERFTYSRRYFMSDILYSLADKNFENIYVTILYLEN